MTGAQFGQLILALIGVAIIVALVVWLLNWLYLRSSKERGFVRTGLGGQKVVMNGGAFVLPIVHEVMPVNMNTLRLEVSRGRERALITRDRMRVDVTSEFYVRVNADADAIAAAAQTLGQRPLQPEQRKALGEGEFVVEGVGVGEEHDLEHAAGLGGGEELALDGDAVCFAGEGEGPAIDGAQLREECA